MLNTFFSPLDFFDGVTEKTLSPTVKTVNTEETYLIKMVALGIKKSDLTLSYQESTHRINISGKSDWMTLNHYILLPKSVIPSSFSAKCEDGILTITVEKKKPETVQKEIKIELN